MDIKFPKLVSSGGSYFGGIVLCNNIKKLNQYLYGYKINLMRARRKKDPQKIQELESKIKNCKLLIKN